MALGGILRMTFTWVQHGFVLKRSLVTLFGGFGARISLSFSKHVQTKKWGINVFFGPKKALEPICGPVLYFEKNKVAYAVDVVRTTPKNDAFGVLEAKNKQMKTDASAFLGISQLPDVDKASVQSLWALGAVRRGGQLGA